MEARAEARNPEGEPDCPKFKGEVTKKGEPVGARLGERMVGG